MSSEIDPYRDWLGIKSAHRPPNHYELLDLKLYESDRERIENSEMIEMAKVLRHENGPHAALATQIARELEEAVRCLLDPVDKAAYDADLLMTSHAPAPRVGEFQVQTVEKTAQLSGADFDFSFDLERSDSEPPATDPPDDTSTAPPEEHQPHHPVLRQMAEKQETSEEQDSKREQPKANKKEKIAKPTPTPPATAAPPRPTKKPKSKSGGSQVSLPEVSAKKLGLAVGIAAGLALAVWLGMLVYNLPPGRSKVLAMIGDADSQVRIQGLYALRNVEVDPAEAATLLLKVLREDKVDEVRLAAVNALIDNGVNQTQKAEIKPLLDQEQHPTVKALLQWLVPPP